MQIMQNIGVKYMYNIASLHCISLYRGNSQWRETLQAIGAPKSRKAIAISTMLKIIGVDLHLE